MFLGDENQKDSRLKKLYAQLPDGKLHELLLDIDKLTDSAKQLLQDELQKCNLSSTQPSISPAKPKSAVFSIDPNHVIEIAEPGSDLTGWVCVHQTPFFDAAEFIHLQISSMQIPCLFTLDNDVPSLRDMPSAVDWIKIC